MGASAVASHGCRQESLWVMASATTQDLQNQCGFTVFGKAQSVVIPNEVRNPLLFKWKADSSLRSE
jgi:hypothetical protein